MKVHSKLLKRLLQDAQGRSALRSPNKALFRTAPLAQAERKNDNHCFSSRAEARQGLCAPLLETRSRKARTPLSTSLHLDLQVF